MEEKKAVAVKETNSSSQANRPEKMSYEQLENIAHQLSEQSRQLYKKLQEAKMENMFNRLKFLFKVVENGDKFKPEFLSKCVDEIEDLMTIPEEESEESDKN